MNTIKSAPVTLFDDDHLRRKLDVMTKWDAMVDDGRNPDDDFAERVEAFLKFGKRYQIVIVELADDHPQEL